jgi:hypothetical protein
MSVGYWTDYDKHVYAGKSHEIMPVIAYLFNKHQWFEVDHDAEMYVVTCRNGPDYLSKFMPTIWEDRNGTRNCGRLTSDIRTAGYGWGHCRDCDSLLDSMGDCIECAKQKY